MAIRRYLFWFACLALLLAACKGRAPVSSPTAQATSPPPVLTNSVTPAAFTATPVRPGASPSATSGSPVAALNPSPEADPDFKGTPLPLSSPTLVFQEGPISPENADGLVQIREINFSPWDLVMAISWSPDGEFLAVSAGDDIHLYETTTWENFKTIKIGAFTHSLALSPDGLWMAAASRDGFVRIWNTADLRDATNESTQPDIVLDAHRKGANCVVFSPDSRLLASGGNDAIARIWSVPGGGKVNEVVGGTFAIPSITFTPDGASLAMLNGEVVRLRDITSGRIVGTILVQGASFYSLAISPDGRILAAGDRDNMVRLWDPSQAYRTGQETYPVAVDLVGHAGKVGSYQALIWQLTFSPNGSLLASAGGDATVRLWDPASAELLATLYGHASGVTSVAFSPEGSYLASGGLDATLRIWGLSR